MSLLDLDMWNMDGSGLVNMTQSDFTQRLQTPDKRHGENLFAQFDIWRTNYNYDQSYTVPLSSYTGRSCGQESHTYNPPPPYPDTYWPPTQAQAGDTFEDIAYVLRMMDHETQPMSTGDHVAQVSKEPVQSPPPYPHSLTPSTPLVAPPSTESSDFGVDPMEEEEGESFVSHVVILAIS